MFTIEMLPAKQGDCLWVEYGAPAAPDRILIDGGVVGTYDILREKILALPELERRFELIVVSHVDRDHIEGLVKLLTDETLGLIVDDFWFNGYRQIKNEPGITFGSLQGEFLSALIQRTGLPWNEAFDGGRVATGDGVASVELPGGMKLTLLSPTPAGLDNMKKAWEKELVGKFEPDEWEAALEYLAHKRDELVAPTFAAGESPDVEALSQLPHGKDTSKANASSIAFLAEYEGTACLFSADATPEVIGESVQKVLAASGQERLPVDALKISHHGGRHNSSRELFELLDCPNYLISSNGTYYGHPHDETIARILAFSRQKPTLHFNHFTPQNQIWEDPDMQAGKDGKFAYAANYPAEGVEGLKVTLQA